MTDEPEDTPTAAGEAPRRSFLRRHWGMVTIFLLVGVPVLLFTIWAGITLTYTYSSGERAGYVQKLSKKGWICKTWEGELAMVNMPGAMSQIFPFTVRSDSLAEAINQAMVKGRVVLYYEEHRGVPTSCFGETGHFVKTVRAGGV
jgi:hypothetical protein